MDSRAEVSLSESLFQLEQDDWQQVNSELRHHGLAPVELEHPLTQPNDAIVLSAEMSRRLRKSITTLARDCDRRQELIQELILTNNHLREELKEQHVAMEKQEGRIRELKRLQETSKIKIQELEEERENASGLLQKEEEKFGRTQSAIAATCDQLQKSCASYERELRALKARVQQDSEREVNTTKLLDQLQQKATDGSLEEKVVNLINSYERQISNLKQQVQLAESPLGGSTLSASQTDKKLTSSSTEKSLIKSYERQLREARKQQKRQEERNALLRLEMEARPQLKDLREAQARIKQLQRSLCDSRQTRSTHNRAVQTMRSTDTEPDHMMKPSTNANLTRVICDRLQTENLEGAVRALDQKLSAHEQLLQFTEEILVTLHPSSQSTRGGRPHHAPWCEKSRHKALNILRQWAEDQQHLADLQRFLADEMGSEAADPSMHRLTVLIKQLLSHESDPKSTGTEAEQESSAFVDHFKELFDVRNDDGILSRMSDVYVQLGEGRNALRHLRQLLELDDHASTVAIVNRVAQLCESEKTLSQICRILSVETSADVVESVQLQENFVAAFQPLLIRLKEVLDVNTIDQVLPSVKALRVLARNPSVCS